MIVLAALVGVALAAVADVVAEVKVLATGLDDPRFITEYNGRLYFTTAGAESAPTGIARIGGAFELRPESGDDDDDDHHYHLRQLASFDALVADSGHGIEADGPAGIAVHDGRVFVVSQLSDSADEVQAEVKAATGFGRELDFGRLVAFDLEDDDDNHNARKYVVGNPGAAGYTQLEIGELLNVPGAVKQPEGPDTDPYGIYYDEKDDTVYVANAASNFLQAVKDGETRTVAFFPATAPLRSSPVDAFNFATGVYNAHTFDGGAYVGDATPTSVTKGPDGYLYVCTLELVQWLTNGHHGKSNIYRIDPRSSNYVVTPSDIVASDLTTCTDVHYSRHHHAFFAAELFGDSIARFDVKRANGDDDDDSSDDGALVFGPVQRMTGFTSPNGVTTDSDGRLFVVDGSTGDSIGRVLRVKV